MFVCVEKEVSHYVGQDMEHLNRLALSFFLCCMTVSIHLSIISTLCSKKKKKKISLHLF